MAAPNQQERRRREGSKAWGEVAGRPPEGHGEELMAIPPIQKLKRDDGVRRMLAAPQPTRREKESKEHAGRPPTNKRGEGEKETKHGERLLAAPQPTRIEKESKEDAGRPPTNTNGEEE